MRNLEIKWSVSKARDTMGYNICTLIDRDHKFKTYGGGYDMVGTVFGQWLKANYMPLIKEKVKPHKDGGGAYGLFVYNGEFYLDGACGLSCMVEIAKAIGLKVGQLYSEGRLTNFVVEEI